MKPELKHWNLIREPDGLACLQLDRADSSTNTLSPEVLDELANVLAWLEQHPPAGLILSSVPTILVFVIFQRYITEGTIITGLKL